MRRILLFPLSGYANRLQAIASSRILADRLGAVLSVCWEPERIVPVDAAAVFSAEFCDTYVITTEEAKADFRVTRVDVPRYLTIEPGRILLAGNDRGEQHFMGDLRAALQGESGTGDLVIAAGGKFFMPESWAVESDWQREFRGLRHDFYRHLRLHPAIEDAAAAHATAHDSFVGLHLRYSDRAHQTPLDRNIKRAVLAAASASGLEDVFIASDTTAARERWTAATQAMGLRPWSVSHAVMDRSTGGSERAALVDWRLLGHAERLVYFAESSFAVEAAVASDGWDSSVALAGSPISSALVRTREYWRAGVTYPRRHGWPGSHPK